MTRTNTIGETLPAHDGHEDLPRSPELALMRKALEQILEEPKNTLSDGKALTAIVRIAKKALAANPVQEMAQAGLGVPGQRVASDAWQPIATAPKDGSTITLGYMEDGVIAQQAEMQWSHIQRNGFLPGVVGMWVCPGGNFTWNPDGEFAPSHWKPVDLPTLSDMYLRQEITWNEHEAGVEATTARATKEQP